jgi:hypothetical protein
MSVTYKNHINIKNIKNFTSKYYINLGKDIDDIINGYVYDLNQICNCASCMCFSLIFENYNRKPLLN